MNYHPELSDTWYLPTSYIQLLLHTYSTCMKPTAVVFMLKVDLEFVSLSFGFLKASLTFFFLKWQSNVCSLANMQSFFIYVEPSVSGHFEAYLPMLKHLWEGKIFTSCS